MVISGLAAPIWGGIFFAVAIVHTLCAVQIFRFSGHWPKGSVQRAIAHFFSEVELIFPFWAVVFMAWMFLVEGGSGVVAYLKDLNFKEPIFIFIMVSLAVTEPVLFLSRYLIKSMAALLPFSKSASFYLVCMIFGPLLGSFITEPAAMTVVAMILKDYFFSANVSERFKYGTLGLLFVNISLGGALTVFAAPPILMVASRWNWDNMFVFSHFGWRSIVAVTLNTFFASFVFKKDLKKINSSFVNIKMDFNKTKMFSYFRFRYGFFAGLFLAGLVVLGGLQNWWLTPFLTSATPVQIFFGAIFMSAFIDNAALTYLGSLVPTLTATVQYLLVAGALLGGGFTIMANAPNPIGFGILSASFQNGGIRPLKLAINALPYTVVAVVVFLLGF